MLDQPGHVLDPVVVQAHTLAHRARRTGAGLFLAPGAALAGVMQQHGQHQGFLVGDQRIDGHRQGMVLHQAARRDVGHHAHRPQGMLVHRIGVVHVELHLGDDAAPFGDIAA